MPYKFILPAMLVVVNIHKAPYIVKDTASYDRCTQTDPEWPCPGRLLLVKNPSKKDVLVKIGCGLELLMDTQEVIKAKKSVYFDIGGNIPAGLSPKECYIKSWKVWNGKSWR